MIEKALNETMIFLKKEIENELIAQGHRHTGKLINSIEYKIAYIADSIVSQLYMNDYWIHVNEGVKSYNIPFKNGSGAKSSKYIQALIVYFKQKGFKAKDSKSFAFATAKKHIKEGMPTKASRRFSQNGKRVGFLTDVIDREMNTIIEHLNLGVENVAENALLNILTRVRQKAA